MSSDHAPIRSNSADAATADGNDRFSNHQTRSAALPPANTLRVRVVGFWRRFLAGLVDLVLVVPVLALSFYIVNSITDLSIIGNGGLRPEALLELVLRGGPGFYSVVVLTILILWLYDFFFIALRGSTPGLQLIKARIIDTSGAPPHWARAALRASAWLLSVFLLFLGLLWVAFDREKRGLHDRLAGTYVILPPID